MSTRRLKPGESVPSGPPRRYSSPQGYVRLRWRLGVREEVEVAEHRVIDGRVTTAEEVHHKNHDRTDNRPENLEYLSKADHYRRHASAPDYLIAYLYLMGGTTLAVARMLGTAQGHVSVVIRRVGVPVRDRNDHWRMRIPEDEAESLLRAGVPAGWVADHYGVSRTVMRRIQRERGIPPFPAGAVRKSTPTVSDILEVA